MSSAAVALASIPPNDAVGAADGHASFIDDVCARIATVLPAAAGPYALHEPTFGGAEWACVKDCLDSGWVSSAGPWVARFEHRIADFTGAAHVVATVNGTVALHAGLIAAGVGPGDEVLVPALTFVATANAVRYCGALPHFVDIERASLGVDATALGDYLGRITTWHDGVCVNRATGRPLRALIAVHCLGHPPDLAALAELAKRFNLIFVEDAAEALGSYHRGAHVGRHGRFAILSFNGNKTVTAGGGGALMTDDAAFAQRVRHLTTTARVDDPLEWRYDAVGFNYRMPALNAALGVAQFERLEAMLAAKRRLAARYCAAFATAAGVRLQTAPAWADSNYWLNALVVDAAHEGPRDALAGRLVGAGYQCRALWAPLHRQAIFADCPAMAAPVAEAVHRRGLCLPSSASLGERT